MYQLPHSVQAARPLSGHQLSAPSMFACFCPGAFAVCFGVCCARILTSLCLCRMSAKELDFAAYDLDEEQKVAVKIAVVEAKYENAFDGFVKANKDIEKAAAQAAHDKEVADIKAMMTPAQQATMLAYYLAQTQAAAPVPRVKYDHETTKKNLVKNTAAVRALMETQKDDYDAQYFMWTLSAHYMSLHNINEPMNKIKRNAHVAFVKYFKKYQHEHGLPPATPTSAGSKTSSRAASRAASVIDEGSMDEDEDEEAGAGAD